MAVRHPKEEESYPPPNQPAEFAEMQQYPVSDPPPAYPGQQEIALGHIPVVGQNIVVVQRVVANNQLPGLAPGCAFCKFVPGIVETIIRLSLVVSYLLKSAFVSIYLLMPYHS